LRLTAADRIKAEQLKQAASTGINPYKPQADQPIAQPMPTTLAHYQLALKSDLATLQALRTVEEKVAFKREVIKGYLPFVQDYINSDKHYANPVAVRTMVWLFDIDDIERGIAVALKLIKQQQAMPSNFDRDLPTFLCDAVYDWANTLLEKKESAEPYLKQVVDQVSAWDLHPAVSGKMYVMAAKHSVSDANNAYENLDIDEALIGYKNAVLQCEQAENANKKAGAKTLKAKAQAGIDRCNKV
jgi:hypothetical protein